MRITYPEHDTGQTETPMNYLLLLSFISYAFASFSWANPTDAQKNFKQWIASERLISKESADWEIQKAAIGDLIELLEEEEKSINENLDALENENSAGEEERIRLSDQNEDLKSAIVPVSETLQSLEQDIFELLPRFPKPLQDDLQGFVARLPDPSTKEAMMPSISQRLQAVVGALAKIDKFNSSIALDEKLMKVEDGEIKVSILHFGLGIAYFSDESGNKAGYMLPGDKDWVEFDVAEAGPAILESISFYNRTAQKQATFINLPFQSN